MRLQQSRIPHRLLRHHLPLLAASLGFVACLALTRPYTDLRTRVSFGTAYPALVLVALTLLLGPLNVLLRRRNPVSSDLRRDIGIWAGILSLVHTVSGQFVHLRGRPWLYYLSPPRHGFGMRLRTDLFGFSNDTGGIAALLVLALLATSNDLSLRALGTPRWKALQRWNYLAFALIAAHTFAYQSTETLSAPFRFAAIVSVVLCCVLQLAGYLRRLNSGPSTPARQA